MSAFSDHVRLAASGTGEPPSGPAAGDVPDDESIEVTLLLRGGDADASTANALLGARAPAERDHLDLEALQAQRGTSAVDLAAVDAFARHFGLEVTARQPERRSVSLRGTAAAMRAAFQVSLAQYASDTGTVRVRTSPVHVPTELDGIVRAVVGFDTRPQVRPHMRRMAATTPTPHAGLRAFTPIEIAERYRFPATTGRGQTVAILEFGGGFDASDLAAYFGGLGVGSPTVIGVSVDGASTAANVDPNADGEVQLDIDVVGAVAPDATIVVYFAPNSARGFVDALTTAIHDPDHRPCAISISWGMMEEAWSQQTREAMDEAFKDAGMLGITVSAASGDDGSTDNEPQGAPHTDYPAASPWVLGCGGTILRDADGGGIAEDAWDDRAVGGGSTGGGISTLYPVPDWQASANSMTRTGTRATGRGVPDVAGDACPSTGYRVRVDGTDETIGGTSAVAPLWAALIARMTEAMGTSIGFLNPLLYGAGTTASLRDVTRGSNGAYSAAAGWDPCTGLGTPDGEALQGALATTASMGQAARPT